MKVGDYEVEGLKPETLLALAKDGLAREELTVAMGNVLGSQWPRERALFPNVRALLADYVRLRENEELGVVRAECVDLDVECVVCGSFVSPHRAKENRLPNRVPGRWCDVCFGTDIGICGRIGPERTTYHQVSAQMLAQVANAIIEHARSLQVKS